jgi:hypothetical protein
MAGVTAPVWASGPWPARAASVSMRMCGKLRHSRPAVFCAPEPVSVSGEPPVEPVRGASRERNRENPGYQLSSRENLEEPLDRRCPLPGLSIGSDELKGVSEGFRRNPRKSWHHGGILRRDDFELRVAVEPRECLGHARADPASSVKYNRKRTYSRRARIREECALHHTSDGSNRKGVVCICIITLHPDPFCYRSAPRLDHSG